MHASSLATEQQPCPVSIFDHDEITDVQRAWIAAAATLGTCVVVGFATGCLIAAVVGKRIWNAVVG